MRLEIHKNALILKLMWYRLVEHTTSLLKLHFNELKYYHANNGGKCLKLWNMKSNKSLNYMVLCFEY